MSYAHDYVISKLLEELHRAIYTGKVTVKPSSMAYGGYSVQSGDGSICINVETGTRTIIDYNSRSIVGKYGSIDTIRLYQMPSLNHTFEQGGNHYSSAEKLLDICKDKIKAKTVGDVMSILQSLNGT